MKRATVILLSLLFAVACKNTEKEASYIVQVSLGNWNQAAYSAESIVSRIDSVAALIPVEKVIHANKNDNLCSESTLYRLVNANVLGARRIDMPRAVRFKKRNGNKIELKIDKKCREGRTYHDYLEYCKQHPDLSTTEMDSVEGRKGGKVLLTMMFDNCSFMLAFIRERNTAQSVIDIFNDLYAKLAKDVYGKLVGLLLFLFYF